MLQVPRTFYSGSVSPGPGTENPPEGLQSSGREQGLRSHTNQGAVTKGNYINILTQDMKFCFRIQPVDWIHALIDNFKLILPAIKYLLGGISGTFSTMEIQ